MPEVGFDNLVAVCLIAVLAPLAVGFSPRLRVPAVVVEIVVGIIVGKSFLDWVEVDLPVSILAIVGLAVLLFLAGLEIDLTRLRGRLLTLSVLGYLLTLALGSAWGVGFAAAGWVDDPLLVAVALSATSLGLVVAVLKDAAQLERATGQVTVAGATVADFAAILLLSLLFSTSGGSTGARLVLLVAFGALVMVTGLVVMASGHSMRLGAVLVRLQDTTAEIRVRLAVLLLVTFVALAERFGLESILGAFLAGAVVSTIDRDSSSHPHFRLKLEALGYGFLIPVFFVASGIRLDLSGLVADPSALLRVPLFLLALFVARGIPALLYLRLLGTRPTLAAGLLQATSLPFLVTASMIGQDLGLMRPVTAAALVCAGLLSVLVFPVLGLALLRGPGAATLTATPAKGPGDGAGRDRLPDAGRPAAPR